MRLLFISRELIGASLCYRLKQEGCDVRLFIEDESRKDCLDGMVKKTDDWRKELAWVGKDGLIVFDDVGYGRIQDELRVKGYLVVGGSEGGDRLEEDRQYAQEVFQSHGMNVVTSVNFDKVDHAIDFVKRHRDRWVIKQKGHNCMLNYVGEIKDGSDVISVLKNYKLNNINPINLQQRIDGIEIGCGRYFNGKDWVSPIEINIEHKRFFNDDIGPMTGEMGTLMWYTENENNKLFRGTLARLKPYLQGVNFKGNIDINCIVNKDTVYPLEVTSRFGCPSTQLQSEIHLSPWKEFLMAIAKGKKYKLRYRKGFGIVVSVAIPPFPYKAISHEYYLKGVEILFKKPLSDKETNRLHFEEVSIKKANGKDHCCIAGNNGYILYVTGSGSTVQKARDKAYKLIDKIVIPKMFYRTDIGLKFVEKDNAVLKRWGYIMALFRSICPRR